MTALGHIHCIGGLEGIDKELQKGFLSTLLILRRISLLLQEVHKNRRGGKMRRRGAGKLILFEEMKPLEGSSHLPVGDLG